MSIFGSIMEKIFHPAAAAPAAGDAAAAPGATAATTGSPAAPPAGSVDVGQVLTQLASQKGGGGNWQTSIVDLLKLLDLDSSLAARKQLANELNIHVGADGTAEENIALHAGVMQKLAENGGKVPDSLKGHA
jgi:3-oxoacyl-ACP reductase-like protein